MKNWLLDEFDCVVEIQHTKTGRMGEDSLAFSFERPDLHTFAVFDGCGGAGAWKYNEFQKATGAYVAARAMAKKHLEWFETVSLADMTDPNQLAASYGRMAADTLGVLKAGCAPMAVRGTMVKSFPCTLAAAIIGQTGDDLSLTRLTDGDSRVYLLLPDKGLIQISRDDIVTDDDPMQSLRTSPPMTEMLQADKPFAVKQLQLRLSEPFAVLCATDGVFGYVRSPMDFELMLLEKLMQANSFSAFEESWTHAVAQIAQDDVAGLLAFYRWNSIDNVRKLLIHRYQQLREQIGFVNQAESEAERENRLQKLWAEYRETAIMHEAGVVI